MEININFRDIFYKFRAISPSQENILLEIYNSDWGIKYFFELQNRDNSDLKFDLDILIDSGYIKIPYNNHLTRKITKNGLMLDIKLERSN
ncbi:MAG: hypothetical protein HeimC3_12930 [Candidatus Heimdallarchaeota archaeon LC_3]|nr:MAG: hypothetical protein HeimC3_16020 [Candidatus Heimdallarchaeota archaeon LC_3]OLS26019.1 MAG: hypothetical protein HeimC3_12930 [Candidatus Heimdallarchaeota archaeon LC_3]